jgi:hypothetical protein
MMASLAHSPHHIEATTPAPEHIPRGRESAIEAGAWRPFHYCLAVVSDRKFGRSQTRPFMPRPYSSKCSVPRAGHAPPLLEPRGRVRA